MYPVIAEPPLSGADHDTATDPSPGAPTTPLGEAGTVNGTTAGEGPLANEEPAAFTATTVNVYEAPLAKPVTEQLTAPDVEHVLPPGEAVTVYPVIAEPPLSGADHDTTTDPSPGEAVTEDGEPGTVTRAEPR